MDELVEFLRARLDEDEQAAQEATPGPWEADVVTHIDHDKDPEEWQTWWVGRNIAFPQASDDHEVVSYGTRVEDGGRSEPNAHHIARHDPAYVLADVEAKRRIVELHSDSRGCDPACSSIDYPENAEDCETLRQLVLPFADHPDYREAWRP